VTVEQPHGWLATLVPFAIIGVVVLLRLRTMRSDRKLDLKTMWAVPIVYVILIAFMFTALPPTIFGWELILAGLAIGLLVGWYRGRMIKIRRDPETGELRQKASPLAMLLLVAIIVLKLGARQVFGETAASNASSPAMLMTDAFIGFALGLLTATRLEMYTRAKRLLAAE
jgi:peptidoglycan/LPS O-acetylase OafA/YrhL